MPLIYKPYQATLANKEGQKLYYPRLVKFGKMVNTQKMAELIAEKASLTAGDVHNVIRNLMSVMREQLLNSRTVRLEGLGTFTKQEEKEWSWRIRSAVRRSLHCVVSLPLNTPVPLTEVLPAH